MRRRTLLAALFLVCLLPLRDVADQLTCCNATSSLASSIGGTVAGDEAFFKLPTGPSNVMFLLDTSGSMAQFPQCGDNVWDTAVGSGGLPSCISPAFTLSNPAGYSSSPTYTATGTCTPSTSGFTTSNSTLAWMESVVPQTSYADPGQTNSLLMDCPPWGNGGTACGTNVCSGSNCLFDPTAYYLYNDWSPNGGGSGGWNPTTTRRELDSVVTPTTTSTNTTPNAPCVAIDASGNVITDVKSGLPVSLGSTCTTCMATHGFYLYKINYYNTSHVLKTVTQGLYKGTFLNANPPKFVTARQVVKGVAWMDPANPRDLDQVRLGLAIVDDGGTSPRKARLIVPLGPDMNGSYPPTQLGFRQSRQYLLSVLNYDTSIYKDSGGNTIIDGSTTGSSGFQYGFFNPATGGTPMGSALFNVGQYFTAVSPSLYTNTFTSSGCGGSCVTSEFNETSAGRTNAAWVTKSGNVQHSICWGCQASSIVVVTDGSPNNEITFPSLIKTWDSSAYSHLTNCNGTYAAEATVPGTDTTFKCTEPNDGKAAGIPRVADWIHQKAASGSLAPTGLRYDLVLGGGQRALDVDTIGINLTDARAIAILNATANMGGGTYENAANPAALTTAVYNAVNRVTPKNISFSSSTSNSLQTVQTAASQAFITRFRPNTTNAWEGHVFEAFLFDEFLNGCDPSLAVQPTVSCGTTTVKSIPANYFSGTNVCTGTFLIDLDCDEIIEDTTTGNWLKKGTATLANLPWDAGQVLSYQNFPGPYPAAGPNSNYRSADETAANARNLFTWVNGQRVNFTGANAATIQPYLNISTSWCTTLLAQLGISGGSNAALECAKQIIYYVRGWDVLGQGGTANCAGPDNPTNLTTCQRGTKGEERDRPTDVNTTPYLWKLGDISHSSPAVVQAPIDEIRCDTGYEKQCTWAIHSPAGLSSKQTKMDAACIISGGANDCYQYYRNNNISRERVLLVGSNDGMLHAFDAGSPTGTPDITGNYQYTYGTGAELWAFVPPDMLPKLKDLMSAHQYMVDGSVMLRDIWVDGTAATDGQNTPTAPNAKDGVKQTREFHTIAIFGRRSGGTQYSALDVTNPLQPTLLWNFPQSGSDDSRYMAQSWADFAPRPPPIVPVKMASSTTYPDDGSASKGFAEVWTVMLPGGYDPNLNLGRAVFMLDAWTGKTLWRFTDDDFKANLGFSGGSAPSMFPVTAAPGPVDLGDTTQATQDIDGFFDIATWGDLGGNVFVARFWTPGVLDGTTGRVNNWFVGRAFEEVRRTDDAQYVSGSGVSRNEFYYMTANTYDSGSHTLHTYLGSGDREQLMQQSSSCGTDNLFGCVQAGCTNVSATSVENYGACSHTDTFSAVNGLLTHTAANTCATTGASCAASPGNAYTGAVNLSFTCPGSSTTAVSGSSSCDINGVCTIVPVPTTAVSGSFNAQSHNRFYGIVAYGGVTARTFSTQATAKTYDQNRLTDISYASPCFGGSCTLVNTTQAQVSYNLTNPQLISTTCADGSTKCTATSSDPGWYYEYGDVCPLQSCPVAPPWTDEKTGAGANVVLGCTTWGGFRPYGVTISSNPCSGNQGAPTVYDYSVNYITGQPSSFCNGTSNNGNAYIASQRSVTAAPGGATVRVDINQNGQINYSVLQLDSGSPATSKSSGTRSSAGNAIYWLQVPRQLHQCRHVDPANCN